MFGKDAQVNEVVSKRGSSVSEVRGGGVGKVDGVVMNQELLLQGYLALLLPLLLEVARSLPGFGEMLLFRSCGRLCV